MSTREDRIEELVSLYSIGAISQEELGELEKYLKEDPEKVAGLIRENEEIASLLSLDIDDIKPPTYIKDELLRRVRIRKDVENNSHNVPFWKKLQPIWYGLSGAVAAAVIIFMFSGYFSSLVEVGDSTDTGNLTSTIKRQKETIASLRSELEDRKEALDTMSKKLAEKNERLANYDDLIAYLRNPNVLVVDLGTLKTDMNSAGRVLWDKQMDSAIFYGINLPQVPQDKTYQLWAIIDSKPVSCGIFNVDQQGNGKIKIPTLKDSKNIQKFAVTLEPAGGVPAPTGEMYLAGGI